jgi:hypothetical protein
MYARAEAERVHEPRRSHVGRLLTLSVSRRASGQSLQANFGDGVSDKGVSSNSVTHIGNDAYDFSQAKEVAE